VIRTLPELIYADNGKEDIDTDGEDHAYDDIRYGLMEIDKLPTRFAAQDNQGLGAVENDTSFDPY